MCFAWKIVKRKTNQKNEQNKIVKSMEVPLPAGAAERNWNAAAQKQWNENQNSRTNHLELHDAC